MAVNSKNRNSKLGCPGEWTHCLAWAPNPAACQRPPIVEHFEPHPAAQRMPQARRAGAGRASQGTSVAALKRAMAAEDPTGLSRPEAGLRRATGRVAGG